MLIISKEQVLQRWDILPQPLREALFDDTNANIIWKICEDEHIPKDKIHLVATVAGDVILGFMHPEELAQEIKKTVNIDIKIAEAIAEVINRKIFIPLKKDLEEAYKPVGTETEDNRQAMDDGLLQKQNNIVDLKDIETEKTNEISLRQPADQNDGEEVKPIESDGPAITNLSEIKPISPIKEEISENIIETNGNIVEINRSEILRKTQNDDKGEIFPRQLADQKEDKIEEEIAPTILHKESEIKPIAAIKNSLGGLFGFGKFDRRQTTDDRRQQEAVKAEINIDGKSEIKIEEPKMAQTEKPKMRMIDYGGFENVKLRGTDADLGMNFDKTQAEEKPIKEESEQANQADKNAGELIDISKIDKNQLGEFRVDSRQSAAGSEQQNINYGAQEAGEVLGAKETIKMSQSDKGGMVDLREIDSDQQPLIDNREPANQEIENPKIEKIDIVQFGEAEPPKVETIQPPANPIEPINSISSMGNPMEQAEPNNSSSMEQIKETEGAVKPIKRVDFVEDKEVKLEDIPVSDDVVDLRKIGDER